MNRNLGDADRTFRLAAGLILLALVVLLEAPWRWLGLIGIVPLLTALAGWCPAYVLFGMDTSGNPRKT